jgi:O-antigen/teichoic acid export membrane protein
MLRQHFRRTLAVGTAEIVSRLPLIFLLGYAARQLGPSLYGAWTIALAAQGIVAGAACLGLPNVLPRQAAAIEPGRAKGLMAVGLALALGLIAAVAVLAVLLPKQVGQALSLPPGLGWLALPALGLAAASVADSFVESYFRAIGANGRKIGFSMLRTGIEAVSVLTAFATPMDLDASGRLVVYAGLACALRLVVHPPLVMVRSPVCRAPGPPLVKSSLRMGLALMPVGVAGLFLAQGDRLVLGQFGDHAALGLYAFAATLAGYVAYIGFALYPLLLQQATRLHEDGDAAAVAELFEHSQMLFVVAFAPVLLGFALIGGDFIALTAGAAFASQSAVAALVLLGLATGIEQAFGLYQYAFLLARRPSRELVLALSGLALHLAAIWLAATLWGVIAAPAAIVAVAIAVNLVRWRWARKLLHLRPPRCAALCFAVLGAVAVGIVLSGLNAVLPLIVRLALPLLLAVAGGGWALHRILGNRSAETVP